MEDTGGTASDEQMQTTDEWDVSDVDAPAAKDVPESLSLDVVFDMLKNERRRRVMRYLRNNEGPFTLGELAEHIAALENDKSIAALSSGERKRVYVGLYQCHLPRMDDAGVIDFDRNRGSIALGPNASALDEFLEADADDDVKWSRYYLAISTAGGLLYLALELGAPAFGLASNVVVLGVLAIVGASSYVQQREGSTDELIDRVVPAR